MTFLKPEQLRDCEGAFFPAANDLSITRQPAPIVVLVAPTAQEVIHS